MFEKVTILFCAPQSKPELIEIENTVSKMEEIVKGPINAKTLDDNGLCVITNELGEVKDLALNRVIHEEPIFGPCFFCRKNGEEFISLFKEEQEDLKNLLD
ncbi:MAG: DUF3846 domain-containing protein [Eubacteriales bacterium]